MSVSRTIKGLEIINKMQELDKKESKTESEIRCVTQFKRGMFVVFLGLLTTISLFFACFIAGFNLSSFKPDVKYNNVETGKMKDVSTAYYTTQEYSEDEGFKKEYVDVGDIVYFGDVNSGDKVDLYFYNDSLVAVVSSSYRDRLSVLGFMILGSGLLILIIGSVIIAVLGRKLTQEARDLLEEAYN